MVRRMANEHKTQATGLSYSRPAYEKIGDVDKKIDDLQKRENLNRLIAILALAISILTLALYLWKV